MKKLGVIDLGTNTFHLLIVEVNEDQTFRELYRSRVFVKLAEDGIGKIGALPFQRGLQAIKDFRQKLDEFEVSQVKAFGTAALRTSTNGMDFIQQVKAATGIEVQLIPGSEEARLIHKGVRQAVDFDRQKNLIMDIGGGSVEFIIADKDQVYWAQSFPIGVAVLYRDFHHTDPITTENIRQIEAFLESQLQPLFETLSQHQTPSLIGASGTFDVVAQYLCTDYDETTLRAAVTRAQYQPLFQLFLPTTLQQRLQMEGLPDARAEMIIVALILIDFIMRKANIQEIIISAYAMKEGMLREMLDE